VPKTTAKDVAAWMAKQMTTGALLYQETVVGEIRDEFGADFVYENDNGNLAIAKEVLKEFRILTPDVVWMKGERAWRKKEPNESGGRTVDE